MPLPKPKKNESHDDFLDRCMGDDVMVQEYPDEKQRYAVCQGQWDQARAAATPELERRALAFETGEIRVDDAESPRLTGYAAKYGIQTDLGWFREKIKAGAFDEALTSSDARALKNHDPNLLLGRESSGTLRLSSNSVGLRFEIDVPATTTGRDTLEEVRRGDLAGCSFAFTVAEDEWKHREGEQSERTIVRIAQLFDVGPVTYPAYEDTTVVARSVQTMAPPETKGAGERSEIVAPTPASESQEQAQQAPAEISAERRRQIEYDYQEMGRLIRHVAAKQTIESPES